MLDESFSYADVAVIPSDGPDLATSLIGNCSAQAALVWLKPGQAHAKFESVMGEGSFRRERIRQWSVSAGVRTADLFALLSRFWLLLCVVVIGSSR